MTFFSKLFTDVDLALNKFLTDQTGTVIAYVNTYILSFAVIFVIGIGVALLMGWTQEPAKKLLLSAFTVAFVIGVATSLGTYNTFFANFLRGLPDDLIGLVSGGQSTVGGTLDEFGNLMLKGINSIYAAMSGWNIGQALGAFLAIAVFFTAWLGMSAFAVFGLLIAKIAIALLVTTGPLFITFLLFPQTRDFFTKWLTYTISFSFLAMMIGGFLAITETIALDYFTKFSANAQNIDFVTYAAPLLVMLGLWKMFADAPGMASSVAGGIGLSAGAAIGGLAGGAVGSVRRGVGSAARSAASTAYQKTGRPQQADAKRQVAQEKLVKAERNKGGDSSSGAERTQKRN